MHKAIVLESGESVAVGMLGAGGRYHEVRVANKGCCGLEVTNTAGGPFSPVGGDCDPKPIVEF